MSRRVNTGFKLLLERKAREWGESVALADAAAAIGCSRQSLGAYANGHRALPYIEAKLAGFFSLTVRDLRATLFSNNTTTSNTTKAGGNHETPATPLPSAHTQDESGDAR